MMWSVGALLELIDRARLEDHMKNKHLHLDLPECTRGPNDSIFDYRVDENGMCLSVYLSRCNLKENIYTCVVLSSRIKGSVKSVVSNFSD